MNTLTPATDRHQDEARIRELMAGQETAMRARDAAWLVSRYGAELVRFSLAPPLAQSGPEQLNPEGRRTWFAGFDGEIDYEIRDLTVTAGEDVAFCHSLNRLTATPKGMSQPFDLWFRATVGLRKIEGTWRITHEHESTPFHMDGSFRAAVELRP
jgi:ketosteroid isomerase-like protein